jgi:hypothetical protein
MHHKLMNTPMPLYKSVVLLLFGTNILKKSASHDVIPS